LSCRSLDPPKRGGSEIPRLEITLQRGLTLSLRHNMRGLVSVFPLNRIFIVISHQFILVPGLVNQYLLNGRPLNNNPSPVPPCICHGSMRFHWSFFRCSGDLLICWNDLTDCITVLCRFYTLDSIFSLPIPGGYPNDHPGIIGIGKTEQPGQSAAAEGQTRDNR
jgi:hypothetical protein